MNKMKNLFFSFIVLWFSWIYFVTAFCFFSFSMASFSFVHGLVMKA